MKEENRNIIKFEISNYYKFMLSQFWIIGQCMLGVIFIIMVVKELNAKQSLNYILTGPVLFCGLLSFISLMVFRTIRKARMASELTIDKDKKEFCAYIYDIKKEVKFGVDDIVEINSSSSKFKFCLKDGTWVTWEMGGLNQQSLKEIIKSFGLSIINKKI